MSRWTKEFFEYEEQECCKSAIAALGNDGRKHLCAFDCPFPFCIKIDARLLKRRLNNQLARVEQAMLEGYMRPTISLLASELGVSQRTINRRMKVASENKCYWCLVDRLSDRVICRTKTCTVALGDKGVMIALAGHRKASTLEHKLVGMLSETLFPDGVLKLVDDNNEHSHWEMPNVEMEEANRVYDRMTELSKYAPVLR